MSVTRIAEKAGVSIATVSRVLNNSRPVNPKIAEMVRRAMEELQLPPRQLRRRARSRSGDRNATIAIVSVGQGYRGWFELPVIASVVAELTRAAQELHMGVLMAEMPDPNQLSPVLRRPEVDGALIFISSDLTTKATTVLREQLPVVRVMGGQLAPVEIDHIGPDNNAIGYVAGQYLLQQGLHKLAYLTCKPVWDFSKLRAQGFMAAAQDAGITPTMYLQQGEQPVPVGFYGPRVVAERDLSTLIARLREGKKERLGLFVSRDEEAVHAYRVMREAGLEPGTDVVVVSCDNEIVRLSTLHPRPASIDLGASEIARYAVRRLAQRIKHQDEPPARILVNPRLVVDEIPANLDYSGF